MARSGSTTSEYDGKVAFFSSGLVEPNDFALQCNDFLDKMKQSSAFELVKSIKKFITNFSQQKPRPVEEAAEEIRQFLDDTSVVIERHPLWRTASAVDVEIAAEALERYAMHKIHKYVYSPSREDDARRDREFQQRLEVLSFISPALLDIPISGPTCEAGWEVASNQLKKMENCKSPRDKVTCVMNLFTVLCKLLVEVSSGSAAGADDLMPNVIYTILRAKPAHWYSDVRYIQRFRHPGRLSSEAGYYMTQMMGAVAFLEKIEGHHLSLTEEEFRAALKGDYVPVPKPKPAKARPQETATEKKSESNTPETKTRSDSFPKERKSSVASHQSTGSIGSANHVPEKQLSSGSSSSLHSNASRSSRSSQNDILSPIDGLSKQPSPHGPSPSQSPSLAQRSDKLTPTIAETTAAMGPAAGGVNPPRESAAPVDHMTTDGGPASLTGTVGEAAARRVSEFSGAANRDRRTSSSFLSPLPSVTGSPVLEAGIVDRFLDCKLKDLTIGDMTELLKNYRILVQKYCTLRAQATSTEASLAQVQLQASQRPATDAQGRPNSASNGARLEVSSVRGQSHTQSSDNGLHIANPSAMH